MKIFLDDYRIPMDCIKYMHTRIGPMNTIYNDGEWFIVRNYPQFVNAIDRFKGEITHISFDHDLADAHYHQDMQEGDIDYNAEELNNDEYDKTGYHAAQYLKEVYEKENLKLPLMFVHSMNPVGTQNIINLFK